MAFYFPAPPPQQAATGRPLLGSCWAAVSTDAAYIDVPGMVGRAVPAAFTFAVWAACYRRASSILNLVRSSTSFGGLNSLTFRHNPLNSTVSSLEVQFRGPAGAAAQQSYAPLNSEYNGLRVLPLVLVADQLAVTPVKVYAFGQELAPTAGAIAASNWPATFTLCQLVNGVRARAQQLAYWETALSAQQVLELYNEGRGLDVADLLQVEAPLWLYGNSEVWNSVPNDAAGQYLYNAADPTNLTYQAELIGITGQMQGFAMPSFDFTVNDEFPKPY